MQLEFDSQCWHGEAEQVDFLSVHGFLPNNKAAETPCFTREVLCSCYSMYFNCCNINTV